MQTGVRARQALDGRVICLTRQCRARMLVKRRADRRRVGWQLRAVLPVVQLASSVVSHSSTSLRLSRRLIRVFFNPLLLLLPLTILAKK